MTTPSLSPSRTFVLSWTTTGLLFFFLLSTSSVEGFSAAAATTSRNAFAVVRQLSCPSPTTTTCLRSSVEDGTSATAAAATTPALDDDDATAVGNTDESVADDAILSSSIAAATAAAPAPAPSTDATTPTTPNSNNRQAQYGVDLDLPSSYVRCGNCQSMFAMTLDDLGARGRRLECSVCGHSWFQSRDRILTVTSEFELLPMLQRDLDRIQTNMDEGKAAKFVGDKKLYVGNISFQSTEDDLFELFGECGDVGEVTLVKDEDGRNRGFGFVTMRTIEGGDLAIAKLDGMAVRGRNMAVRSSNN